VVKDQSDSLENHTIALKSVEIICLMRLHPDWTFEQACEFVVMDPLDFSITMDIPAFIPLPDEIAHIAAGIRSGEILVGRAARSRKLASIEPAVIAEEVDDDADDDSPCPVTMPAWFHG
tara:strand:+ start:3424 stop:3780 length:357 start_codon:yes stop_codon:yes gene_type:complete